MKVLVIPTWYPNGEDKLMGIYHKEFTQALNNHGIRADMLFIDRQRLQKPIKYLFMKKKLIEYEDNYKVFIYRMLNVGRISFNWQLKRYVKTLKKAFKDYLKTNGKPDVIHAHVTVPAGYAACIIGKMYNIPVIVTEHCGNLERFFNSQLQSKYGMYVLENSTFSTVSNYMRDVVLKYADECYVIPNLVDTTPYLNDTTRKVSKTFRLVSVCALREAKRIDVALEAIKILVNKGYDVHYDIIGDGFYEDSYKSYMRELELQKYVSFLGRKEKKEIAEILKKEHALLISSEIESFGIPGIEAMASGLVVITTDCQGPPEYVDSKCGVVCEINNPDDMANKIIGVMEHYSKYNPNYIKKKALNYSEDKVINEVKKIYDKIKNS